METKNKIIKDRLLKHIPECGVFETGIKGFHIARRNEPSEMQKCFYKPTCIIAFGGQKLTVFGSESFTYGPGKYVVSCTDVPVTSRVLKATPQDPCIAMILALDSYEIAQLILKTKLPPSDNNDKYLGAADVDQSLLDTFGRLAELLDQPQEQRDILAPMIIKEIYYRILIGPLGNQLRRMHTRGTQSNQISEAILFLKNNYKEKLSIEDIAQNVNMAPSSFYRNFKRITKTSPLQYLKQLRLYEAQRLMLTADYNATSACYEVGYESPAQFSREYKKMFGNPPKTDIIKFAAV